MLHSSSNTFFQSLVLDQTMQREASRKALTMAHRRAENRFASYIDQASNPVDKQSRFEVIEDELKSLVFSTCEEYSYPDPELVLASVKNALDSSMQHEARRPKMCPYHREVTDIALTLGDPKAAFDTTGAHQFSEHSCRGSWDGNCSWKPEMVTQDYWDKRQEEADLRAEQRLQLQQEAPITEPQLNSEESIPDYQGGDIDAELEVAPSAVGMGEEAPEPVLAKKKKNEQGTTCLACSDGHCGSCVGGQCGCGDCGGGSGGGSSATASRNPFDKEKGKEVDDSEGIDDGDEPDDDDPKSKKKGFPWDKGKEAQFAENVKKADYGAPGNDNSWNQDSGYKEAIENIAAQLESENPGLAYNEYITMAQQIYEQDQSFGQVPGADFGPSNMYEQYPHDEHQGLGDLGSYGASVRQAAPKDGDSTERHEKVVKKTPDTITGLDTKGSPPINKERWNPENLKEIDTEVDGSPHPTINQDPTAPAHYTGDPFTDDHRFEQTQAVSEKMSLPTADWDGGGFNTDKTVKENPGTETWHGMENQTSPVTTVPSSTLGSFVSDAAFQQALANYKG